MATGERTGRPAGSSGNHERILEAARAEFAIGGFEGTSLRAIASRAGVNVALLAHYFGNKNGLFAATLELPQRATGVLVAALEGDGVTSGERLTRGYLSLWEDPITGPQMQALARSAMSNDAAGQGLYRLMNGTVGDQHVAPLIVGRETQFALAMSSLFGVSLNRYLMAHPKLVSLNFETLVSEIGPVIQRYLE